MRTITISALVLLLLAVPASGCFDPDYGEGGFQCQPADGQEACPEGYSCQAGGEPGQFVCRLPATSTVEINVVKTPVRAGDKLKITLAVTGFSVAPDKLGKPAVGGEGHFHVFIDTVDPLKSSWTTVTALEADIEIPLTLGVGTHKVIAVLVNNDHSLVSPRVQDEAEFDVEP